MSGKALAGWTMLVLLLVVGGGFGLRAALTLQRAAAITPLVRRQDAQLKAALAGQAAPPSALGRSPLGSELVPLSAMPKTRQASLLAVEDPGFYRHHGLDFKTPGQGMTTLPQSLVKRLYFKDFRPSWPNKFDQDVITALELERHFSKADELEMFINTARFGHHGGPAVIGFGDAARRYFHKAFSGLTGDEFLSLVAMLMAPDALDPAGHPAANAERVARIRRLLARTCRPRDWRDVSYPDCAGGP